MLYRPLSFQCLVETDTINICDINCIKFLDKTIGISFTATHKLASNNLKQQILLYLQSIDIKGEYKLWILKNFSSFHFHIAILPYRGFLCCPLPAPL